MDSWVPRATRLARCTILRCLVPHTQTQLYGCTVYCISGEAGPARRADRLDAGRLRDDGGAQDLGVKLSCLSHAVHMCMPQPSPQCLPSFHFVTGCVVYVKTPVARPCRLPHWPVAVLCSLRPEAELRARGNRNQRAVIARAQQSTHT